MSTESVVSSDAQDLRDRIAKSLQYSFVGAEMDRRDTEDVSFTVHDTEKAADRLLAAVVEPVLSELRAGFAQSARRSVAIQRDLDETLSKLSAVRVEQHDLRTANDQVLAENRRLASDNVALRNAVRWSDRDIAALTARMGTVNTIPDDTEAQWGVRFAGDVVRLQSGEAPTREYVERHNSVATAPNRVEVVRRTVSKWQPVAPQAPVEPTVGDAVRTNKPATPALLRRLVSELQAAASADLDGAYDAGFADGQTQAGNDLEVLLDEAAPVEHLVTYSSDEAGHLAFCHGCKDRKRGTEQQVQDWGDAHQADTLVPAAPPVAVQGDTQPGGQS